MYDMYPWDAASQGDYPPSPLRSRRDPSQKSQKSPTSQKTSLETSPARAVQVALDRRDNGGDAQGPAGLAATPPPAGRTRQ
jgi:hypothetical protein